MPELRHLATTLVAKRYLTPIENGIADYSKTLTRGRVQTELCAPVTVPVVAAREVEAARGGKEEGGTFMDDKAVDMRAVATLYVG